MDFDLGPMFLKRAFEDEPLSTQDLYSNLQKLSRSHRRNVCKDAIPIALLSDVDSTRLA